VNNVALLAQSQSGGSPLGLIILLLPVAAIVFLMIVPQRRQRQKQAALMGSLSPGDEVVTIGGLYGVITVVEDDVVHLEVDNDVVLRFSKAAISRPASEPEPQSPAARRRTLTRGGSAAETDADVDEEPDSSAESGSTSKPGTKQTADGTAKAHEGGD
jgi:preprotein translocase subunit YajC